MPCNVILKILLNTSLLQILKKKSCHTERDGNSFHSGNFPVTSKVHLFVFPANGICLFPDKSLQPVPSLFKDYQLIGVALYTHTATYLKSTLFHPVPLYDKLRYIFSAVYGNGIGFHSVDAPLAVCSLIHYGSVNLESFHNLKHPRKYNVFPKITGFHKIIVLFYPLPLPNLFKQDMPVLMQKS